MTITQIQANHSYIQWLPYLNSLMPASAQFTADDIIINAVPDFFTRLEAVLNQTSRETIANYLMWRVAFSAASSLPKAFRDRAHEYNKALTGREEADPRGLQCTSTTLRYYFILIPMFFSHCFYLQLLFTCFWCSVCPQAFQGRSQRQCQYNG